MKWFNECNVKQEIVGNSYKKKISKIKEKNSGVAYIDGVINWPRFSN